MNGIREVPAVRVTRGVTPRDLGDRPVSTVLAALFWLLAALFLLAPVLEYLLVAVVGVMWAQPQPQPQPQPSPGPAIGAVSARCVAATLALALVPLGFASGVRRLALNARLAVLGLLACALSAGVFPVIAGTRV
jgi:hypothetical protein